MAGARAARSERSRYTSAGYVHDRPSLYIASVPAGSAQENLRDLNRRGYDPGEYRSERPWRDAPQPVFEQRTDAPHAQASAAAAAQGARVSQGKAKAARARREDFWERLARRAAEERREVVLCVVLTAAILMIFASWGQKMVAGVRIQNTIAEYQAMTDAFEKQNEQIEQQLELAREGERVRNRAQNELGMLRPERAQKASIFIQTTDLAVQERQEQTGEPRMELLDVLLGLLNVFHIGE